MNVLKIGLAVLIGFASSAVLFRTPEVKAQEAGKAHVFIVPVLVLDAKSPTSDNLPGAKIAGISCVPKPTAKLPDAAVCYVATTLN